MNTIERFDHSQDLYSEIGLCNKRCRTCIYGNAGKTSPNECHYIIEIGHRRPCPAGKNCTVYVKRIVKRKRTFKKDI